MNNSNLITKHDLLKSFHEQFANNQNHHQTLFVQFLSAVVVVLVGYVIVYTNTSSTATEFDVTRIDDRIIGYSITHLLGSYTFGQLILTLLCMLILNMGYSFRRDQNVNRQIRKYYLSDEEYMSIFYSNSYDPVGKKLFSYLPTFNMLFVIFIYVIQLLLFGSIIYAISKFTNFSINDPNNWILKIFLIFVLSLPLLISLFFYFQFFRKYKKIVVRHPDIAEFEKENLHQG